jgi:hypothetical protein
MNHKTEHQAKHLSAYRSKDWHDFRAQVLKIDGYKCQSCFRSKNDDVILQVHHKQYFKDTKPWDYPFNTVETLCKGCHAEKHGHIPPKTGWSLVGTDDLGDLCGHCELCNTDLRYLYMVFHPKWGTLEIGTDCCDRLTGSNTASEHLTSQNKYNQRKKTFISSPRWNKPERGIQRRFYEHAWLQIERNSGQFLLRINSIRGKERFQTEIDAKIFIFDLIHQTPEKFKTFLKKYPVIYP